MAKLLDDRASARIAERIEDVHGHPRIVTAKLP